MDLDSNTKLTMEALSDGNLASSIKSNAKYTLTGMVIGAVVGGLIAGLLGKNKFIFGLAGAIIAGSSGYLIGNKK